MHGETAFAAVAAAGTPWPTTARPSLNTAAPPHALPDVVPPDVVAALAAGRKIDAIRAYREATGADLKTAKEVCEALARGASPKA